MLRCHSRLQSCFAHVSLLLPIPMLPVVTPFVVPFPVPLGFPPLRLLVSSVVLKPSRLRVNYQSHVEALDCLE